MKTDEPTTTQEIEQERGWVSEQIMLLNGVRTIAAFDQLAVVTDDHIDDLQQLFHKSQPDWHWAHVRGYDLGKGDFAVFLDPRATPGRSSKRLIAGDNRGPERRILVHSTLPGSTLTRQIRPCGRKARFAVS